MANIFDTLHPKTSPSDNLYPNIKKNNIPDGAIDMSKLSSDVKNSILSATPKIFDTSANILALTSDGGVAVATDTGYVYVWDDDTSAYVNTNVLYQSTGILDGSIDFYKTSTSLNISLSDHNYLENLYKDVSFYRYYNYGFSWYSGTHYTASLITPFYVDKTIKLICDFGYSFKVHFWTTTSTGQGNYISQLEYFTNSCIIEKGSYITIELRKGNNDEISTDEITAIKGIVFHEIDEYILDNYIKSRIERYSVITSTSNPPVFATSTTRICIPYILTALSDIKIHIVDNTAIQYAYAELDSDDYAISARSFSWTSKDFTILKGTKFVMVFRKSDNTRIDDVDDLLSNVTFGTKSFLQSNIIEIENKLNDVSLTNIFFMNQDAFNKLIQSRYLRTNTYDPFTLLHFTDLHADSKNLLRIMDMKNKCATYIDDAICTGDIVYGVYQNDFTFWALDGANDVLICVGNHDSFTQNTYDPTYLESMANVESKFITPYISNWGNVTHTLGTTYYYKDYTSKNIRLIVVDCLRVGSDATNERTWLTNVLNDAITNNLNVIIATHYIPSGSMYVYDCEMSVYQNRGYDIDSTIPTVIIEDIVQNFINNDGKFICYLTGHTHRDLFGYVKNYPDQTVINLTTASSSFTQTGYNDDQNRIDDTKSQDAFNFVSVDIERHYIQVIRVGADLNMFGLDRKNICFDYESKIFIKN